ncbi:MAG: hypothetical protein JW969_04195 [Spirochaetales bacterium]|nr:hypothetical protein [Spirochaetales bacterium]
MKRPVIVCLAIILAFLVTTCDLFKPGLGEGVDLAPPFLFITSHANGDYVKGSITLSGNFEEDVATASVAVSVDDGATYTEATLNQQARTWSIDIDTATIADGEHDIIFKITDSSNKTTDKKILLYVDNTAPLIIMTVPNSYAESNYGSTFTIKGEAMDTFGIQTVSISVYNDSDVLQFTDTANGTASWSYTFDSASYVNQGNLKFTMQAIDRANNASTKYFFNYDIKTANDGNSIYIDELYPIYIAPSIPSPAPTPPPNYTALWNLLHTGGETKITLYFDQNKNLPTIEIFNPNQNFDETDNILNNSAQLSGKASDEDDIKENSIEIYVIKQGETVPIIDWTAVGNAKETPINWKYSLSSGPTLDNGIYILKVRASDVKDYQRVSPEVYFTIDSDVPEVSITNPVQGAYFNGNVFLQGEADDSSGIDYVEIFADGVSKGNANLVGTNWDFTLIGLTSGNKTITATAHEGGGGGKESSYNLLIIIDKENPTVSFLNPAQSSTVNGLVLIRGTSSDNTQIPDNNVELRIGKPLTWIVMDNEYNWEYQIDSTSYATSTYADDQGGGVWKLYIHARVTDKAGNTTTRDDYYFLIDNDTDKPKVNILSPSDGQNLAGPVLVSGTAVDDDAVDYVEMQIDVNGDGDFSDVIDFRGDSSKTPDGFTDDKFENETLWYTVDGQTAWTEMLNNYGEMYARTDTTPDLSGDIIIRVRAVDINVPPVTGNYQQIAVHLDDLIPRVENLNYESSDYVRGSITLTGDAYDDPTTSLSYIQISYNGGVSYEDIMGDGLKVTYVSDTHYQLHITINTASYIPTSGIFYLRLKVIDSASLQSIVFINLNVDNQPPTASWSTSITHPDGSNLYNGMITVNSVDKTYVEGNYGDSGAVSGISHIELYLVKSGSVRNLKSTGTWGGTPTTESITVEEYDLGTNTWSTDTDPAAPYVTHAALGDNYVIKIDKANEMSDLDIGTDIDGDGYHEFLGIYDGGTRWRAYFDSQYIPDGIVDLHYVAYDLAGNRYHAMRQVFIANNRPVVDRIRVGSDLNYSTTVADVGGSVTEIQDYYYPGGAVNRTDFQKIKNNKLYFAIEGSDPGGSVKQIFIDVYDSGGSSYLGPAYASALNPAGGDITVTLNVNPGTAPWTDDGNYTVSPYKVDYRVKVTVRDNDDINVSRWVKVSVLNPYDATLPVVILDALSQSHQDGSTGHLELQGDNTVGDWNIIKAAYGNDNDPKGSGVIIFKGTVTDENRLTEINVTSENNPMSQLASWSGGQLASNDTNVFTIDSQALTENGHTVTFTYKWDSSYVTGIAGLNKTVSFGAKDGAAIPNNATPDSEQLDIVPYIKSITRQYPLPANRTKYGKFLLTYGETNVVLTGFNLGSGTYLPTVTIHRTGGTLQNTITVSGGGSPYTTLLFTGTQMQNSGWLRVTVNSQQSINNLNANTLTSNKEDDGSGLGATLWNDDRYLLVFDIGDYFTGSDAPEWPAMSINPSNGHLYGSWTSYNTAVCYYGGPNSVGGSATWDNLTSIWSHYDPPEYTDIFVRNNGGADVKHTVVLENENAAGPWQGLTSHIDAGSARTIEYLGGDDGTDTNTFTIDHSDGKDEMLFQFKNPRFAVNVGGTPGNDVKYVSYYDAWSKCLKYAVVTGGTGTFIAYSTHQTDNQVVVDGFDWLNSDPTYKYASSEDVGLWSDIGIDPDDDVPVIVYYSASNKTLKIARGWDTQPVGNFNGTAPYAPSGTHEWNIANVRPANSYLGSYVSMIIDSNASSATYGDLFIVTFQNATGDLVFIHGHDVDGTGSGLYYTFDAPVTIDSEGSVGAWSNIALMYNGATAVPYVSYLNSSAIGTLEGLKYAWVNSGDGSSAADWEYGIIPVNDPVRDHRSNIEVSSSVNIGRWVAGTARSSDVAVGFAGTYFNLAYRMKEQ